MLYRFFVVLWAIMIPQWVYAQSSTHSTIAGIGFHGLPNEMATQRGRNICFTFADLRKPLAPEMCVTAFFGNHTAHEIGCKKFTIGRGEEIDSFLILEMFEETISEICLPAIEQVRRNI